MSLASQRPRLSAAKASVFAFFLLPLAACSTPEERAQRHFAKGQELLAKGDVVKANIELRNAIKNKKDLVPAWRALAEIEEKRQNWGAQLPMLKTIVEYDPNDDETRLKLARLLLLAGALQDALPVVSVAAERPNPKASAVALRAALLLALKDPDGAIKEAQRASAIEPDNFDAVAVLATEQLSRRDVEGALQSLAKAKIVGRDQETAASLLRIHAFEQTRDMGRIEGELRKLVELDPSTKGVRRQLVAFYVRQGRDLDAEQEMRAVAAAEPSNVEAVLELVRFLNARKGPDAAQQELEARVQAGGDVFAYQLALAEFQFLRGKPSEAIAALQKLGAETQALDRKVKAQLSLAGIHMSQKNFAAAEPVIADILKADARNTDALRLRAVTRLEQNQLDNAITDLRQALNEQPQSAPLLQLLGTALERTGAIELAEKQFAEATRAAQFAPKVGMHFVGFLQRRGSAAQAEEVLSEIAARNPRNLQVLAALADAKLRRQDWVGAQEVADIIKRVGDERGIADQIRGQALSGQNKLNESIQVLQTAFQATPNALSPLVALVSAYMRAQKPAEAETFLKGLLSVNPANANALVLMGSVQMAKNQPEQALRSIQRAVEQQPQNPIGYSALADYHLRRQDTDQALAAAQAGLKVQPENFRLRLLLATTLESKKDIEGAIREYEAILVRQPDSLIAANNLASLLADNRDDKSSLERAQALGAVLRRTPIPQFKDTVGWLSYHRGDYRTAVGLLEEAAEALPSMAVVRYHLGMAYLKAGQTDKAHENLRKAAELSQADPALKAKIEAALRGS